MDRFGHAATTTRLVAREAIGAFVERFDCGEIRLTPDFAYEGVPVFLENGSVRLDVELAAESSDRRSAK